MQALQKGMKDMSVVDKEEFDIIQQLQFRTKYSASKYRDVYAAHLDEFLTKNDEIDLGLVQDREDTFFAIIKECFPAVNVLNELRLLKSKAKSVKDGYEIEVEEAELKHLRLFHFVAKAGEAPYACVLENATHVLSLDDETPIYGCLSEKAQQDCTIVFVPSYARWCKEELIKRWCMLAQEVRVVFVVRKYEFEAYYEKLDKKTCSILCLPDDTQWGIGYARYIIVEVMKTWNVKYGIMCDDSMCRHWEWTEEGNYRNVRTESGKIHCKGFVKMLTTICDYYRKDWFPKDVACISPTNYRLTKRSTKTRRKQWGWKAPTMCQVLNIELIRQKGINFRPQLRVNMEDLIFGMDCFKAGLKCLTWYQYALHEAARYGGGNRQNTEIGSPKIDRSTH